MPAVAWDEGARLRTMTIASDEHHGSGNSPISVQRLFPFHVNYFGLIPFIGSTITGENWIRQEQGEFETNCNIVLQPLW
jgi:hypothetical protein